MLNNWDISLVNLSNSPIEEIDHDRERKRKLKKEIRTLGEQSQFHGINRMITRNLSIKIIWLAFFLMSMSLCTYTIITNIQQYLSYGVNTLVQVVPQNTVLFPTVSVCNLNPFVTPQAFQYIASYYSNAYNITLTSYTQFYELVRNKKIHDETDWLFYRTFDSSFNRTLRDSFSYNISDVKLFCNVQFYQCNYDEFRSFYHSKYGNCFIFNSGIRNNGSPIALEYVSAEEFGLEIELFNGLPDIRHPYIYEPPSRGFVIMIGEQNVTSLNQDGISASPGLFTNVALKKSISTNLPKPYNDCYDSNSVIDTDLANEMRRQNISYDRHNCFTLCRQMIIIEKLGCYDMRYPGLFNAKPCNNKTSFELLKNIDLDLNKCEHQCPFECETTIYEPDISYTDYPNMYQLYYHKMHYDNVLTNIFSNRSYSLRDLQQTIARIWVYFDPMTFTVIGQSPSMTFADLVANIGGALGLFLGISILSLVELIEISIVSLENWAFLSNSKLLTNKHELSRTDKEEVNNKNDFIQCNDDKLAIWPEIKNVLKKSGRSTTLHGLPKILVSDRLYIKIVWLIFTLVSIGFCVFMIYRTISGYLQYELKSQIRQMPQKSVTFPSIQICNTNSFVTPEANAYLNEFYYTNYGHNFTTFEDILLTNDSSFLDMNFLAYYQSFLPGFNQTKKSSFSYSLEDFIVACEFDSKPCNFSWFEMNYHPFFGKCFVLNSGFLNGVPNAVNLLKIEKPSSGLYLELFHGVPDEYYNYLSEYVFNSINIYINDQGHTPIFKSMRPFKPGSSVSLNLALTHFVNLPAPYSNCQEPSSINTEIVQKMRHFNISYDRFNCMIFCQQMLNYYGMGCFKAIVTNIYEVKEICITLQQLIENQAYVFDDRVCPIMCPAQCEQNSYDFEASFSDFPSKDYAYKLVNDRHDHYTKLFHTPNITHDMIRKSVSSFYFYFDELVVTEIIESPSVEFVDLISNIGGILGLFAGLSVLSFVEIIELTANIVNAIVRYKRYKKIKKSNNI